MKKNKYLLLFGIIIYSFNFQLSSQVLKFKAYSHATKVKSFNEDFDLVWEKWSDWQENSSLITIDSKTDRIKVFSNKTQIFDIIEYNEEVKDEFYFDCVDNEGKELKLELFKKWTEKDEMYFQFYIRKDDIQVVFNLKLLDNE
jgi:hypothetical protein